MTATGWLQLVVLVAALTALTPLLGGYMSKVYQGEHIALGGVLGPAERLLYRALGVDPRHEQRWTQYARSLLLFGAIETGFGEAGGQE